VGFALSRLADRIVALIRRHSVAPLNCRPTREWRSLLTRLGFVTEALPMSQGTPFANVLLVGKLP